MNPSTLVDVAALKLRLPEYLATIGHTPVLQSNGTRLTARCPLHQDAKPSFAARLNGGTWIWFCHPCGTGGTVIDLHAKRTGLDARTDFARICADLADVLSLPAATASQPGRSPANDSAKTAPKAMDADELEHLTTPWRLRLHQDEAACTTFAGEIGLSSDTLRALTMPSLDAFAIAPAGLALLKADGTTCTLPMARLAYIGDGGYKIRDPFGTGRPRFWKVGELRRPWRSHWLQRPAPHITDVHLVESESTAAALIEAGFEDPFGQGSCVLATSGANGFDPTWQPLFAGRRAHFWPDHDAAGERFFEETAALLHGTARGIYRHQFHAQPPIS